MLDLKAGRNVLPPGNYGALSLNGASGITIAAADPLHPPVFSSIALHDCHDIAFTGFRNEWVAEPGEPSYSTPNEISGPSTNITFTRGTWIGSEADGTADRPKGTPTGRRLMIGSDVAGVTFLNDVAKCWENSLICLGTKVTITRAHWTDTAGDIIQLNGVQDFLLQDSLLGFFRAPIGTATHLDMVQLQMRGALRQAMNIIIRRNDFHSGSCPETAQTVFLGNEGLLDPLAATFKMRTKNVAVLQNRIYAGHKHGISGLGIDGFNVGFNSLIYNPAVIPVDGFDPSTYWPGIDVDQSLHVNIHDNLAASLPPGGRNNLVITPDHYPEYFAPEVTLPNCPLDLIKALPGGLIYTGQYGAASVRP